MSHAKKHSSFVAKQNLSVFFTKYKLRLKLKNSVLFGTTIIAYFPQKRNPKLPLTIWQECTNTQQNKHSNVRQKRLTPTALS